MRRLPAFFMAVLLDSEIAHSAAPIRRPTSRFDAFAEIAAHPVLVNFFTGLLVPEPTTIGSELVAQHECVLRILPRVAELQLVLDEIDAGVGEKRSEHFVDVFICAISPIVAHPNTRTRSSDQPGPFVGCERVGVIVGDEMIKGWTPRVRPHVIIPPSCSSGGSAPHAPSARSYGSTRLW